VTELASQPSAKQVRRLDHVVVRFAGDSGDGMQLTGERFTSETALLGNDLGTLPDFPAEIRAPAGTLAGVSGFQLQFAEHAVLTPGDAPDVLVAMNPAALKRNLGELPRGATVIINTDEFSARAVKRVGFEGDVLTDGTLEPFHAVLVPLTSMTVKAVEAAEGTDGLTRKDAERAKNMFALGLMCWLYSRPTDSTLAFLRQKFGKRPALVAANTAAFHAGWAYGETTEDFAVRFEVAPAPMKQGQYRNIHGNLALTYGLVTAARKAGLPLFLGSYPITPASDILHELSKLKSFDVTTFQAEDEIAGIGSAIGASYGGSLGVTTTSGPGVALKSEAAGLAVMLELPLVIVDVQRGGPSTGLPTKTEQSDLLQVMFGRNGESPIPVVAAKSPADCFDAALEATRIAITYRTPVFLLSDGYIANGSEPWRIPDLEAIAPIDPDFQREPNGPDGTFLPYLRDPETLARPWAVPGTPGLEHRIGGLEKADGTGAISYDAQNHDRMVRLRAGKVEGIARSLPPMEVDDPTGDAKVLVLGWGSTWGPIAAGVRRVRRHGGRVAQAHLRHLNPFPSDLGDLLSRYDKVIIPEMNLGQLALLVRAKYLIDAVSFTQVRGLPFTSGELADAIGSVLAEVDPEGLTDELRASLAAGQEDDEDIN
jgi:2-oxoglutarate/2-oxoacid ferredoxin oxidoreductase subunit alpha